MESEKEIGEDMTAMVKGLAYIYKKINQNVNLQDYLGS